MDNKSIIKTTLLLGVIAAASTALVSALSNKDHKKKVKQVATEFKDKTAEVIRDLERDYREFDNGLGKLAKTREYKHKIDEISKATKTILQQLQVIRANFSGVLSEVSTEAKKAFIK